MFAELYNTVNLGKSQGKWAKKKPCSHIASRAPTSVFLIMYNIDSVHTLQTRIPFNGSF
jgi:hypothetical protein